MCKFLCWPFAFLCFFSSIFGNVDEQNPVSSKSKVIVIPIEGPIASPVLYILKRAVSVAERENVSTLLLDMKTPGGELNTTLKIMEVLNDFKGDTLTFINDEAISAGAYISIATEEIYFAPNGVMGAAAVIQGTGTDIPETAKMKIDSYLMAKVRTMTSKYPYRGKVVKAMMDDDYELKIDETLLKEKGELLTLTADEAIQAFGSPPQPLLSAGTFESIEQILDHKYGLGNYSLFSFEVTWSEKLAIFMSGISPILMGLGVMLLFVEFKTPGFGIFGISGILLLAIVFAGKFVSGLAGNELLLLFSVGCILLIVEFLIFPGTFISGILGFTLVTGALAWSLVEKWPKDIKSIEFSDFNGAILWLGQSFTIGIIGFVVVCRFLPKSLQNRFVLKEVLSKESGTKNSNLGSYLIGREGVVVLDLHPLGRIEVDNRMYDARSKLGEIKKGTKVSIVKVSGSELIVKS